MKKIVYILFALTVFTLSSCGGSSIENGNSDYNSGSVYNGISVVRESSAEKEVKYSISMPSYDYYRSAVELTESAKIVMTGKVTGISFQVWDAKTAQPPTEKTEERHRWLHTVYDIEVATIYKGKMVEPAQIFIDGGLEDYRVDEQLKIMKEMDVQRDDINIQRGMPKIEIGETYLFVLHQHEDSIPTNMTPHLSFYNLRDPLITTGGKYYAKSEAQMSAKDVISVFGEDKWDEFWTQWQNDNPNTWKELVDKAEAEITWWKNYDELEELRKASQSSDDAESLAID